MHFQHFGVSSIPWSPLARGAVCRPVAESGSTARATGDFMLPSSYITASPASPIIVGRIEELSNRHGVTMAQIALAWVMAKPGEFYLLVNLE